MEQSVMVLNRGDIWLIDFNPAKGGEIGKLRPAVIISDDDDNRILDTVIVVPLSTVIEPNTQPYRIPISAREELQFDSDACIYEIRALSKIRAKKKVATLRPDELQIILKSLCEVVGAIS